MISARRFGILLSFLALSYSSVKAQSTYLPINSFTNYYFDRIEISANTCFFNTSLKPYLRDKYCLTEGDENADHSFRYIFEDNFYYTRYELLRNSDSTIDTAVRR